MRAAIVLFAIAIAILLAPAHAEVGRARVAEGYAERVVAAGLLELPPEASTAMRTQVRGGRRVGEAGPLDVAVAIPGALAARLGGPELPDATVRRALGGALVSWLLFATIGSVFFARLYRVHGLKLPAPTAIIATSALLLGTSVLWGARRADATLLTTLALMLLLDELDAAHRIPPRRHALQVALLGAILALADTSYATVALALALLDVGRRAEKGKRLFGALAVVLPIVLAYAAHLAWDARVGLATLPSEARVHALFGILFSTGRSLFVYSPIALLGVLGFARIWGRDRARAEAIAVAVGAALISICGRADWHGDPAFGAPLLIPLLPLFVEPAALMMESARSWRLGFIAFAFLGVALQLLGLTVDVEAWPRVVAELRAATGAPGWFLAPAADIEFVPQLSPLVGQWTLARIALGRPMPSDPPFSLVVGSDQADTSKPPAIEAVWTRVRAKLDRAALRPNLALTIAGPRLVGVQAGAAMFAFFVGAVCLLRARGGPRRRKV